MTGQHMTGKGRFIHGLAVVLAIGLHGCDSESPAGLLDLDGNGVDPIGKGAGSITVALFVDSDCPVSNRYAPEMQRLHAHYAPRGIKFWLVYHGRIDDRYVDITRRRAAARSHDVAAVLDALLAGEQVEASWNPAPGRSLKAMSQPAVGCFIRDFE